MHLAINSGTDMVLFNAWLTEIADKGWTDKAFIEASTKDFDKALAANRTTLGAGRRDHRPDGRSDPAVRGLDRRAEGRQAPAHDVRLRERSDLGQRQLPHQCGARERRAGDRQCRPRRRRLRAHGRPPGRLCASLGRPCRPAGSLCRQAADRGQGRRSPHLGVRPLQDHAELAPVQHGLQEAHRHREGRHERRALWRSRCNGEGDHRRDQGRRTLLGRCRHHSIEDRRSQPCLAACRRVRRDESHVHEWRTPHAACRALYGPARQRQAGLPDSGRAGPAHGESTARDWRQCLCRPIQGLRLGVGGRRLHGRLQQERRWR